MALEGSHKKSQLLKRFAYAGLPLRSCPDCPLLLVLSQRYDRKIQNRQDEIHPSMRRGHYEKIFVQIPVVTLGGLVLHLFAGSGGIHQSPPES